MLRRAIAVMLVSLIGCQAQVNVIVNDVSVRDGETATIPCTYETEAASVVPTIRWYREENGNRLRLYIFKLGDESATNKDSGEPRALDIGSEGQLIIPNATLEDNVGFSTLWCEVDFNAAGRSEAKLKFVVAKSAIADPTPTLDMTEFTANGEYQLLGSCQSDFAYPEPIVEFYRGDEPIVSTKRNGSTKVPAPEKNNVLDLGVFTEGKTTTSSTDKLTVRVTDVLEVNLSGNDDNAQYYCLVRSGLNNEKVQNVSFPLFRVLYPTDKVAITANKDVLLVGDTLILTCSANGNPAAQITDFGGQSSPEYTRTVTAADNGMEVTCDAGNGNSVTSTYTINVAFMDAPIVTGDLTVNRRSSLSLNCEARSNRAVTYMWLKDGADTGMMGETYDVVNADFDTSGTYSCKTSSAVGIEKETSVEVTVNGIGPVTTNVKKSGDKAILSCTAKSNPAPQFDWVRVGSDSPVSGTNETKDTAMQLYTSNLVVGPLDSSFKEAQFECKVTNAAVPSETVSKTLDFTQVEIIETSSPPIAGIIIGILVALLVVAIILAVLYNKGIICKSDEKGDENAEDIAVDINKDEAPGDVESGRKPEGGEEEKLMNGNDQ